MPSDSGGQIPNRQIPAKVRDVLEQVEILDVRATSLSAAIEGTSVPSAPVLSVNLNVESSFLAQRGVYANRFDFNFEIQSEGGQAATISFALIVDYEVPTDYTPDDEAAEFIAATTGYFAAYPYARELLQSICGRLRINPLVLGLLKRGQLHPGKVRAVPTAPASPADSPRNLSTDR